MRHQQLRHNKPPVPHQPKLRRLPQHLAIHSHSHRSAPLCSNRSLSHAASFSSPLTLVSPPCSRARLLSAGFKTNSPPRFATPAHSPHPAVCNTLLNVKSPELFA